jgi:hypothetical protein
VQLISGAKTRIAKQYNSRICPMKIKITQIVFALATLVISLQAHARPSGTPITIGEQLTIDSSVLGEERTILVGLPAGYDLDDKQYPVLYVPVFFKIVDTLFLTPPSIHLH